jgi:6-phospho-beta-glucosidase
VVVGAGSAQMPGIAGALAASVPDLGDATVVLHDIDPEALDLQARLTRSILRSRGAGQLRVEHTTDRRRALDGAGLVLTMVRPGGFPARHLDESIPLRYGIVGQETVGPGGFAMALRSVPVVLEVAHDLSQAGARGAIMLNYTNPVQIVMEALTRHADVSCVGLCDQTQGEARFLGRLLGVDPKEIELDTCGTNHLTFTRAVRVGGRDVTDQVWDLLRNIDLASLASEEERRTVRLFRVLGTIPSSYAQYYFFHEEVLAEQRARGRTRAQEIMELLPAVVESYRREADAPDPRPSTARTSLDHGDLAVSLIAAMVRGRATRAILNVPGGGSIPGLPPDAVVEVPCRVAGSTVTPLPQPSLPPAVEGLVRQVAAHARIAAEAAVRGSRRLAVLALLAHPLVRSLDTAERLVDDLLAAHAAYLPHFARELGAW